MTTCSRDSHPMAACELGQTIGRRRRTSLDRFVIQIALHVGGQTTGGVEASRAILLQGLHDDAVEVSADKLHEFGGVGPAVF